MKAEDLTSPRVASADALAQLRARDQMRTAIQAPLSDKKQCVLYLVNGRERRSPWFYREETARRALTLMQAKHGRAILYRD